MKIISLNRRIYGGIPGRYIVGESPVPAHEADNEPELGPTVAKIAAMREGKLDFYPNACYVIHFTGSKVRTIVPANEVIDIAYDTAKEENNTDDDVPDLPEAAKVKFAV